VKNIFEKNGEATWQPGSTIDNQIDIKIQSGINPT